MSNQTLITGGCGFIGSHMVEYFHSQNIDITVLDKYNSDNSYGWLNHYKYKKDINFIMGDIRDYDLVKSSMIGCKNLIHLAALIGIPYSYISPLAYLRTNIEGTYNVLQAAREIDGFDDILITSTSEVYGSGEEFPMNETHPLKAQSPYSATKISADSISLSFYRSFDLPVTILRPFNNFGPRQSNRAIIPTIISQLLNDSPHIELGNLQTSRDFTFVLDTAMAFYQMLGKKQYGETFNISSGHEITVFDLISKISNLINIKKTIKSSEVRIRPIKSEVTRLLGDSSKIKKVINWQPKYSFSDGLIKTIDWFTKSSNFIDKSSQYIV